MATNHEIAVVVDEIVDQIDGALGADGIEAIELRAADLDVSVDDLVERIKNEIVARLAG